MPFDSASLSSNGADLQGDQFATCAKETGERSGESYNSVGWQGKTGKSAAAPLGVHSDDVLLARYEHTLRADGKRAGVVETDAYNLQRRMSLPELCSHPTKMYHSPFSPH